MNAKALTMILLLCMAPLPAMAYIGPGAGIALIGTFFGFAAAAVATVAMVVAWPVWIVVRKRRAAKQVATADKNNS